MWKNYNRRAQASIRQGKEYEKGTTKLQVDDETPTGAFAVLLEKIVEKYTGNSGKPDLILIGHSTGTIMISEYPIVA